MSQKSDPSLSYNAAHCRVRVTVSRKFIKDNPNPPSELLARAIKKMESEKQAGRILNFTVYEDRLKEVWARLASDEHPDLTDHFKVSFTLAGGFPPIKGIVIDEPLDEKSLADITITASPKAVAKWRTKWLLAYIRYEIKRLGRKGSPNPSHIRSLKNRVQNNERVEDYPIKPAPGPALKRKYPNKPYILIPQNGGLELMIVILDVDHLAGQGGVDELIRRVKVAARKLGPAHKVFEQAIREDIGMAISGVERLGMELPFTILGSQQFKGQTKQETSAKKAAKPKAEKSAAATSKPAEKTTKQAPIKTVKTMPGMPEVSAEEESKKQKPPPQVGAPNPDIKRDKEPLPATYPGRGILKFTIAQDKMSATVKDFKMAWFHDKTLTLDEEWLKRELKLNNIVLIENSLIERAMQNLSREKDINALVLAQGDLGEGGSEPILRMVEPKAAQEEQASDSGKSKKDFRQMSHANLVKKDQHVAEVEYQKPCRFGTDIFGNYAPPPPNEKFEVEMGEGVEKVGESSFFAKRDGLLEISNAKVDVSKTLVHTGDVNLSSGNIEFDGSVIVEGSLDTGASIYATDNIVIKGNIRSGTVSCLGNLTVEGGIISGSKGWVKVKGNIKAEFIENSKIFCNGDLEAVKAILTSEVNCGGSVKLTDGVGRVAGGDFYIWKHLSTALLGFETGSDTNIYLGSDWKYMRKLRIKRKRAEKVEKMLEEDRLAQRELSRKKGAQLTAKHKEQKERVQERISKEKEMVKKLTEKVEQLSDNIPFNDDTFGRIIEKIDGDNTFVFIKGKQAKADATIKGIAIQPVMRNGTFFTSLEEFDERMRKKQEGLKKANAGKDDSGAGNAA